MEVRWRGFSRTQCAMPPLGGGPPRLAQFGAGKGRLAERQSWRPQGPGAPFVALLSCFAKAGQSHDRGSTDQSPDRRLIRDGICCIFEP